MKKQVVVIGGGVAGLATLQTLNKLGITDVLLIEATNRLGGRVHTVKHSQWMVEEGAARIQGEALNPLFQLAFETGHVGGPDPPINWEDDVITSDGHLQDAAIIRKGRSILEHLQQNPRERSTLRYYSDESLGDLYSKRFDEMWGPTSDERDKKAWMYYIHQVISRKFGINSWMNMAARDAANFQDFGRDIIWKGGMENIVHHLLNGISSDQLRLSSPVCQIFWDRPEEDTSLVVLSDGSSYLVNYVVSAMPLGILKEYHYKTFFPPLPRSMSNALQAVDAGVVNRIVLGWDYSWWGPKPFSHQVLWKDYKFPMEMEWMSNIVSIRGNPEMPTQLEMEVFGDAAIAMENMSTEQVIAHLINFLRTMKRQYTVPLPAFFHRSKWRQNQWTRGSYHSYMNLNAVNFNLNDRTSLCPIIANSRGKRSLFFSGEHTSTDRFGTVDGALLSGARAARWVMDEHATQEKLFLVVNDERRRLLPLDDQKLKIDYYQYLKNPTLAYQGALEISDAIQMEEKQIEEEKKKIKRERKQSRKSAKAQKKQKKNKKPKTSHSKEQEISDESEPVSNAYQHPDVQRNISELIQKRSRLSDHLSNGTHQQNSVSLSQSAVPVTTTTVALAPKFHYYPVQSSGPDLTQPHAVFHSMAPSSGEHIMTEQSKEISVVYLNTDGQPADYNLAFNSDDNDEVSIIYLDGQAKESGESGQPSVVYVEGPLNPKLTTLVDALSLRKSNYQTQPIKPDESEMSPTTSKKDKNARKNQTKGKRLKAKDEEAIKSKTHMQDKKVYRNKKKGNKKNGKKNKRNKKNNGKNKQQNHNLEDTTQAETKTSIAQHSLQPTNPTFPYTGGMSMPYYLPYQGVYPLDHFSALSQNLILEEMKRKADSANKGNLSVERRRLQTDESLASSEISTTIRSYLTDPGASFGSYNLESNKYLEHYVRENEDNKSNSNIPEFLATYPLRGTEVQPMNGYQSLSQDSQSHQVQGLNVPHHQTFQPPMGLTPIQQNFHTSSHVNQQSPGNVQSIGQHMSPPVPYKGLMSAHNQQNTQHLNFNSQLIGDLNSQKGILPYHQYSPHSYTLNNHENQFKQHGIDNGFTVDTNPGLKYGSLERNTSSGLKYGSIERNTNSGLKYDSIERNTNSDWKYGSIERKSPQFDYSPQINQPATSQQPFRDGSNEDKENRLQVAVNPPKDLNNSPGVEVKDGPASTHQIPEASEEEKGALVSKTKSTSQEKDRNNNQEQSKKTKTSSHERKRNRQRPNKNSSHRRRIGTSFLNRQRYNRRPGQQPFIIIPESSHLFLNRNKYNEEKKPSKSREVKSSEVSGTKERVETVTEKDKNGKNPKESQENTAAERIFEIPLETSTATEKDKNGKNSKESQENTAAEPISEIPLETSTATEKDKDSKNPKESQENTAAEPISDIPLETSTTTVPQTENNAANQSMDLSQSLNPKPHIGNANQYFQAPLYPGGYPMIHAPSHFPFLYSLPYFNPFMQNTAPFVLPPAERNGAAKSLEIIDPVVNITDNVNGIQASPSTHFLEKLKNVTVTTHPTFPELGINPSEQTFPDHIFQEKMDTMNPESSDENTDIKDDDEGKIIRSSRNSEQKNDRKNKEYKPQRSKLITGFISEESDTDLRHTASEKDFPVYKDILQPSS
ncbi:myb-like protein X [Palaemon carinicauda]|uniref:myb-like protein X n=1 Tax=Palaemon carinicauda TaxID=392227 RepID=UPI0035B6417C